MYFVMKLSFKLKKYSSEHIQTNLNDKEIILKYNIQDLINIVIDDNVFKKWLVKNKTITDRLLNYNSEYSDGMVAFSEMSKYINLYITKSLDDSDNIEETIIFGLGNIPTTYLVVKNNYSESGNLNNDLSHNHFIFNFIRNCALSVDYDFESAVEFSTEFINENKSKIDKLRSNFSKPPVELGQGVDGIAYDIGEDMVLKIFKNKFAFSKAKESVENLHGNKMLAETEANIYDVGVFNTVEFEGEDYTFYYLIIEKMEMIPMASGLDILLEDLKGFIMPNTELWNISDQMHLMDKNKLEAEVSKFSKDIIATYPNKELYGDVGRYLSTTKARKNWLYSLVKEMVMKILTDRIDLHGGNIGLNNQGNLRFFDPAFSYDD